MSKLATWKRKSFKRAKKYLKKDAKGNYRKDKKL